MFYTEKIKIEDALELLAKCDLTEPKGVDYTVGVFRDDGKLVATGSLKGDMMQGIAVDPEHQGEDLMAKVLTALISEHKQIVNLEICDEVRMAVDDASIGDAASAGKAVETLALGQPANSLYLFTKPNKVQQFVGLGMRHIATARPYAGLLEWGAEGMKEYQKYIRAVAEMTASAACKNTAEFELVGSAERKNTATFEAVDNAACRNKIASETVDNVACRIMSNYVESTSQIGDKSGDGICEKGKENIIASLVMNCNPFTKGHRFLVERAAAEAQRVFLFVVQENASLFPFEDRLEMVRRGTADIENVTVLPGGRYIISDMTFPSYFTKEENFANAHAAMDAEIFAKCIAPVLKINRRYVGTEPLSQVTSIYNEELKRRLPRSGVEVVEVPRVTDSVYGTVISASRVRKLYSELLTVYENTFAEVLMLDERCNLEKKSNYNDIIESDDAENKIITELASILPNTTFEYIMNEEMKSKIRLRLEAE